MKSEKCRDASPIELETKWSSKENKWTTKRKVKKIRKVSDKRCYASEKLKMKSEKCRDASPIELETKW